jgi:hypothetical protein
MVYVLGSALRAELWQFVAAATGMILREHPNPPASWFFTTNEERTKNFKEKTLPRRRIVALQA